MTLGTLAVIVVLAIVVGAIIYSRVKARKSGSNSPCDGCSGCDIHLPELDSTETKESQDGSPPRNGSHHQ